MDYDYNDDRSLLSKIIARVLISFYIIGAGIVTIGSAIIIADYLVTEFGQNGKLIVEKYLVFRDKSPMAS